MSEFPQSYGPWTILSSEEKYRDPWVRVVTDQVIRPDGHSGTYCVVTLKPGVCVLAVDDQGQIRFTEEFHYAVGKVTIEAVSGGRDNEEAPLLTAQRELREELGLLAETWIELGQVDPFTANVYSPTHLYLATELSECPTELEGTETLEPHTIPFLQAVEMVMNSQITHAPTCVAILKAERYFRELGH